MGMARESHAFRNLMIAVLAPATAAVLTWTAIVIAEAVVETHVRDLDRGPDLAAATGTQTTGGVSPDTLLIFRDLVTKILSL